VRRPLQASDHLVEVAHPLGVAGVQDVRTVEDDAGDRTVDGEADRLHRGGV
jgi:hypothetical protein